MVNVADTFLSRAVGDIADACRSWQALYAEVRQFKDDLMEHIHLRTTYFSHGSKPCLTPDFDQSA